MKKVYTLGVLSLLIAFSILKAQPPKAFGGVWIGNTTYTDSDENSLNVGSFFLAKTPIFKNLYFGYSISANTEVVNQTELSQDEFGNITTTTITGVGTHLPFEVNLVYLLSLGKFNAWVGGGLNVSIAQADVYATYTDITNGIYCEAQATGETKFTPGAQVFVGGEYVFGGVPYIGGNWGIFAQYKYMYVKKISIDVSGDVKCVNSFGQSISQPIKFSEDIKLTNYSIVVGLTYHF